MIRIPSHSPFYGKRHPKAKTARNLEIFELYRSGQMTQQQIAEEFGISQQRVRQVLQIEWYRLQMKPAA